MFNSPLKMKEALLLAIKAQNIPPCLGDAEWGMLAQHKFAGGEACVAQSAPIPTKMPKRQMTVNYSDTTYACCFNAILIYCIEERMQVWWYCEDYEIIKLQHAWTLNLKVWYALMLNGMKAFGWDLPNLLRNYPTKRECMTHQGKCGSSFLRMTEVPKKNFSCKLWLITLSLSMVMTWACCSARMQCLISPKLVPLVKRRFLYSPAMPVTYLYMFSVWQN